MMGRSTAFSKLDTRSIVENDGYGLEGKFSPFC